ncbi:MAG TPA: hypothetical protein VJL32_03190, partial [Candidatus Paceibacterota bacterium]
RVGEDDPYPRATKIVLRGPSKVPVGKWLVGSTMIAVCKSLIAYTPGKFSLASPLAGVERRIEHVNRAFWGGGTSKIVALFLTEGEARECFAQADLQPCDPRWTTSTRQVLAEIGEGHSAFEICHDPRYALPV